MALLGSGHDGHGQSHADQTQGQPRGAARQPQRPSALGADHLPGRDHRAERDPRQQDQHRGSLALAGGQRPGQRGQTLERRGGGGGQHGRADADQDSPELLAPGGGHQQGHQTGHPGEQRTAGEAQIQAHAQRRAGRGRQQSQRQGSPGVADQPRAQDQPQRPQLAHGVPVGQRLLQPAERRGGLREMQHPRQQPL